jgi:tetratricopeptide (TPR) repeat protein
MAVAPIQAQSNYDALRDSLSKAADALAYHPDSIDLRLRKAAWNVELEQWQYALAEYDKVLAQDSRNVAALFYRAFVNQQLHRYNFARIDYEQLLQIIPGNFEARLGLALLNQKDKHHTKALDGINQLVAAHPDSAVAWAARAGIEEELNMLELAEYDYGKALDLDPGNADYLLARADIRIRLTRYDKARQDLDALVRLGTPRRALKKWYDKCK